MESDLDIRWIQRFDSYQKALARITEVVEQFETPDKLSNLEKEGLIQRFEYTYELAWRTIQDLIIFLGYDDFTPGPNSVLSKALEIGIIEDHDGWRLLKKARETTSHTYDAEDAEVIVCAIFYNYYDLFVNLKDKLNGYVRT